MQSSPSMLTNVLLKCIGVPRGVVEGTVLARANGCACEEYRIVKARLEAERKLADAQVSTG